MYVYSLLGSHRMMSTVGLCDSNFFPTDLPSLSFAYLHSRLLLWNLLLSGLGWTVHRQGIVVPIHTILLMIHCFGVNYLGPLGGGSLPVLMGPFHPVSPS